DPDKPPPGKFVRRKGLVRRLAQEFFPVEPGRVDRGQLVPASRRVVVLIPVSVDEGDAAEFARIDKVLAELVVVPASLLHPGLYHTPGLLHRPPHFYSLVNRL